MLHIPIGGSKIRETLHWLWNEKSYNHWKQQPINKSLCLFFLTLFLALIYLYNNIGLKSNWGTENYLFTNCHHMVNGTLNVTVKLPKKFNRKIWDFDNANSKETDLEYYVSEQLIDNKVKIFSETLPNI